MPPPLVKNVIKQVGPMRREAETTWTAATQLYGALAALRGLAAGEVVEELQHLRELLIRDMADFFVALPARQALPTVLRINRVLDAAVANAVVGYTDALVFAMFAKEGVPVPTAESVQAAIAQLDAIEADYRLLAERRNTARARRLHHVAREFILPLKAQGMVPVVVVSAFDWATDKLEQLAAALSSHPAPREYALLLMSGELRASAAMATHPGKFLSIARSL